MPKGLTHVRCSINNVFVGEGGPTNEATIFTNISHIKGHQLGADHRRDRNFEYLGLEARVCWEQR